MRFPRLKTTLPGALAALLALAWLDAGRAHAEPPSFLAEVDRSVVSPGDVFIYEVTANTSGERIDGYHAAGLQGSERGQRAPRPQSVDADVDGRRAERSSRTATAGATSWWRPPASEA